MRHIKIHLKGILTLLAFLSASPLWSATGDIPADKTWFLQDGTFWVLIIIALLLMYVIFALGEVVVWGSKRKMDEQKKSSGHIQNLLVFIGLSLLSTQLSAQAVAPATEVVKEKFYNSPYLPLYILIFIEVCVILYLSIMLYQVARKEVAAKEVVVRKSWLAQKWEKWNYKVPVEREDEIILDDHDYDGIHELDNSLPPWLNYIFIVTFVFAVIYFTFHFFNISPTQDELYAESVVKAELQLAEYRAKSADFYDENTVVVDNSEAVLQAGSGTYVQYCVACHGAKGEGGVGPNLTDDYWIHGNTINDLFRTVKVGVQEKGMASWKDILSPKQIFEVTNYIKSMHGTNPPNAKEPQGTLMTEGGATADSTVTAVDSMSVAAQ